MLDYSERGAAMMRFSASLFKKFAIACAALAAAGLASRPNIASAASDECVRSHSFREGHPIVSEVFLTPSQPFSAESKVKCEIWWRHDIAANERVTHEEGSYKGLRYEISYKGAIGHLQGKSRIDFFLNSNLFDYGNWTTMCPVRYQPADIQWCVLWKPDLLIKLSQSGTYRVVVGVKDSGATKVSVQIDKRPAIEADSNDHFTDEQTAEILRLIKQGKEVTTKFLNSDGQTQIRKQSLRSVTEALELLQWTANNFLQNSVGQSHQ
jgi:hypothetical protein